MATATIAHCAAGTTTHAQPARAAHCFRAPQMASKALAGRALRAAGVARRRAEQPPRHQAHAAQRGPGAKAQRAQRAGGRGWGGGGAQGAHVMFSGLSLRRGASSSDRRTEPTVTRSCRWSMSVVSSLGSGGG